jgi:predicted Rossmann-fold nucleotide-binding protein
MRTPAAMEPHPERVSLADEAGVQHVRVHTLLGMWDVVNNRTRLRPSRRDHYRVTMFGSARVQAGPFGDEETKQLAAALAALGCDMSTGGGPGCMQAANEGAATAPAHAQSVGSRVDLPVAQDVKALVTEAFERRTFCPRLHQFVLASDAFAPLRAGCRS